MAELLDKLIGKNYVDPVTRLKNKGDEKGLEKLEARYAKKASRRADIALNGILRVARSTSREWNLVSVDHTKDPSWYRFYQEGDFAGAIALTQIEAPHNSSKQSVTVAAVEQSWGPGGTLGTFLVPQTRIAVVQPPKPQLQSEVTDPSELQVNLQHVFDYEGLVKAIA